MNFFGYYKNSYELIFPYNLSEILFIDGVRLCDREAIFGGVEVFVDLEMLILCL